MDLGMNDTLNWGYMHCMIAASREMSDEPSPWQNVKWIAWECLSSHQNTIWWISWHSQAIRRIHFDAYLCRMLSLWSVIRVKSFIANARWMLPDALWKLPIYWRYSPSGEWNLRFLSFIFRIFDFHGWNNIVWEVKLYCLTRQTLVFRSQNNIVWASKCKYLGIEMYSFLKLEAFWATFVSITLHLLASLMEFP